MIQLCLASCHRIAFKYEENVEEIIERTKKGYLSDNNNGRVKFIFGINTFAEKAVKFEDLPMIAKLIKDKKFESKL